MVQLIAIGLIGILVWYVYSVFRKEVTKVNEKLREEEQNAEKLVPLEKDNDGVYRPKEQAEKRNRKPK